MKNKTIRLADITKSNDSQEKKLIFDRLEMAIDHAFADMNLPVKARDEIDASFVHEDSYLEYFQKELREENNQCSLGACFSRNGDLLSQWRGYANDGCGFAIGFDQELFERYLRRDERFDVSGVAYVNTEQLRMIDNDVKMAFAELAYELELDLDFSKSLGIFNDEIDEIAYRFVERSSLTSCLMKESTFAEEDEVRIVFSSGIGINSEEDRIKKKIAGTTKVILKDADYFPRRNKLVLYADMSFEKALEDGIIKKVIIGPKVDMTVDEVHTYLWVRGIRGVEVVASRISYV